MPLHPYVLGAVIGAVGATTFVHANRSVLPEPWPVVAVVVWVGAVALWVWSVLLRPRHLPAVERPPARANLVYAASVAAMLILFSVGRGVLDALDRPQLLPAVIVAGVGAHFVPFASAFGAPFFRVLGWSLVGVGVAGVVVGVVVGAVAAATAAVVAGVVMLGLMTADATRPSSATVGTA
ncbi:hypothetical protein [Lapillicoccus jejuensis]|uniref:Uncharacterized protein n=1 Tax=Lapillicoccus jejuensis TaxID=402171 RepID=A0A542DZT8_9MICO|nr:hypothetical protein [Lapillicoccus jejuensis]TQJ08605.1 hypothetical protein FB458_1696 [Lapillicoccus jejuensis]